LSRGVRTEEGINQAARHVGLEVFADQMFDHRSARRAAGQIIDDPAAKAGGYVDDDRHGRMLRDHGGVRQNF
jgi:hypothetical protein